MAVLLGISSFLPRRRKDQFLLVAAVYVFCASRFANRGFSSSFLFGGGGGVTTRSMRAVEEKETSWRSHSTTTSSSSSTEVGPKYAQEYQQNDNGPDSHYYYSTALRKPQEQQQQQQQPQLHLQRKAHDDKPMVGLDPNEDPNSVDQLARKDDKPTSYNDNDSSLNKNKKQVSASSSSSSLTKKLTRKQHPSETTISARTNKTTKADLTKTLQHPPPTPVVSIRMTKTAANAADGTTALSRQHEKQGGIFNAKVEQQQQQQQQQQLTTMMSDDSPTKTKSLKTKSLVLKNKNNNSNTSNSSSNNHNNIVLSSFSQRVATTIRRKRHIKWEREHQRVINNSKKWDDNPIFVMNLEGRPSLTIARYFKCGLGHAKDIAFYYANNNQEVDHNNNNRNNNNNKPTMTQLASSQQVSSSSSSSSARVEIGRCIQNNLLAKKTPLEGCGKAKIWSSMGYVSSKDETCFFPSMDINAMEALAKDYPRATILQVTQDPGDWFDSLSTKFRTSFVSHCRTVHHGYAAVAKNSNNNEARLLQVPPFPSHDSTRKDWIKFYKWNLRTVRTFAKKHPWLQYVEVSMNGPETSQVLHKHLGISKMCWQPPNQTPYDPVLDTLDSTAKGPNKKINKLPYPIFVASLPKSGTTSTQRYFQCGLGSYEAGHHWTYNKTTNNPLKIGKCMEDNIHHNRSIFEDCGDFKVWTDTGYMDEPPQHKKHKDAALTKKKRRLHSNKNDEPSLGCFYPSVHPGGLEAFYQSHPNGTIMNVVRNAEEWYQSAMAWRKLPERMAKRCSSSSSASGGGGAPAAAVAVADGSTTSQLLFPPRGSSQEQWVEFYHWHSQRIRDFANNHPSLTYVEVSLEAKDTGKRLQALTGIPDFCWGDCNPNQSKGKNCGVLRAMKAYQASNNRRMRGGKKRTTNNNNNMESLVVEMERSFTTTTSSSSGEAQQ